MKVTKGDLVSRRGGEKYNICTDTVYSLPTLLLVLVV